ncbi:MAG: sigma-70 family RNA polymerase sigma factor [Planctomycetota bacterium]
MNTAVLSRPPRPLPHQPSPGAPDGAWSRFAPYRADLVRSMQARGQDACTAEDLAQEAIVRASTARRGGSVGRPRAWLERIALNLLRDRMRPRVAERLAVVDLDDARFGIPGREPNPGDDAETSWVRTDRGLVRASLLVDDLHRVLRELPPVQRRVLELYYLEGRTMREVAAHLSTRPSLAKCWLYRARQSLHRRMIRRSALARELRSVA